MVSYSLVIPKTSSSLRFNTFVDESSSSKPYEAFRSKLKTLLYDIGDSLRLFLEKVGPSLSQRNWTLLHPVTSMIKAASCLAPTNMPNFNVMYYYSHGTSASAGKIN
jgi:hypothetical protein